jgi:D-alanyl-D-alanine carboxypeptidase/D-alanyl-D-alanine-endopeptidase (penicillin-binding protein 4)
MATSTHIITARCLTLALAASLLAACGGSTHKAQRTEAPKPNAIPISQDLRGRLSDFANRPRTRGQFAFSVYDLTADKPVYSINERKALPVASCLKLLTGVAGLHLMGPHYRYATSLYVCGTVAGGILHGDASFRANLDPQLNPPDLALFAKALAKAGVRKVDGRFLLDLVITEPVRSEQHWYPWDLSFSRYGLLYKGVPRIQKELLYAFRAAGVSLTAEQMTLGRTPRASRCLYRYYRPVECVVARMWKNSSNTQATSLLYTIGHRVAPHALPTAAGVAYLRKFLREDLGQTDTALVIHDGCGLCTCNHLSPRALTAILRYAYADKDIYRMLLRHLSLSGVDGTLRSEMNDAKLRGKIHGKTGTLSHPFGISSLAGYCVSSDGHTLAFAIVDSEMSVLDARVLQERLCRELIK